MGRFSGVKLPPPLYLVITAMVPYFRMLHHAGTNHVQVDVNQAPSQGLPRLNDSGMIPVFPESPLAIFALVVFLTRTSGDKLHGRGNAASVAPVSEPLTL